MTYLVRRMVIAGFLTASLLAAVIQAATESARRLTDAECNAIVGGDGSGQKCVENPNCADPNVTCNTLGPSGNGYFWSYAECAINCQSQIQCTVNDVNTKHCQGSYPSWECHSSSENQICRTCKGCHCYLQGNGSYLCTRQTSNPDNENPSWCENYQETPPGGGP